MLPGGRTLLTLVHRSVQVEGGETTTAISFVTKGQRDAVTVLTDWNRTVLEFPTGSGGSAPAAIFFLKSEAAAEATIAQNTTGLFLGGDLGASVELTSGSSTAGALRGYRIEFPSFNNAIDDAAMPAGFPIENVSQAGYWVLQQENLNATYRVCLDYGGIGGVADASELAVLTRDSDAEPWRPLGSTVDTGSQQVCADGLTTFSQFAVGGGEANPLPVELARFDVAWSGEGTLLTWQTASETNNAGFHVERKEDAGKWRALDFVQGHGTTESVQSYHFTDGRVPFAVDTLYYRLRQVDHNGTESLTDEIVVVPGAPERLALYAPFPSPARGSATLRYSVPSAMDVEITVYNVLGQRVATLLDGESPAGRVERELNVSRWPSGTYFVRMIANGYVRAERLTVLR